MVVLVFDDQMQVATWCSSEGGRHGRRCGSCRRGAGWLGRWLIVVAPARYRVSIKRGLSLSELRPLLAGIVIFFALRRISLPTLKLWSHRLLSACSFWWSWAYWSASWAKSSAVDCDLGTASGIDVYCGMLIVYNSWLCSINDCFASIFLSQG